MRKLRTFSVILFTISLSGCAASPSSIPPAFVPKSQYAKVDCNELRTEMRAEQERLYALSKEQSRARKRDIAANILLVPDTAETNHALWNDIALSKGKIAAMDVELTVRCTDSS
ncbi:MAG: hypothetical protein OXG05_10585 [Gammaproteobacteria bacterium]|nr:hypothetical protein [Gammaproteobacteria bacterium]